MSDTKIEWAKLGMARGKSVNPIRAINIETGQEGHFCVPKSDGCKLCYASNWNTSPRGFGTRIPYAAQNAKKVNLIWRQDFGLKPFRTKQPAGWFPCDMTDWLGWDFGLPYLFTYRTLAMAAVAPWHRYFLLTKRYENLYNILTDDHLRKHVAVAINDLGMNEKEMQRGGRPVQAELEVYTNTLFKASNIWFGVSICNQKDADEATPHLMNIREHFIGERLPQPVIGISYEPALSNVNWSEIVELADWLIIGGESDQGTFKARYMEPLWAMNGIETFHAKGKPVFVKQAGNRLAEEWGCTGKGVNPDEWPEYFRVREYPEI